MTKVGEQTPIKEYVRTWLTLVGVAAWGVVKIGYEVVTRTLRRSSFGSKR